MADAIKDDDTAWRAIFDWLDEAHATIAPSVFDMLAENAILLDRRQSLTQLCTYKEFAISATTLQSAVLKGTSKMAASIYDHLRLQDPVAAKKALNDVFERCALTNHGAGMDRALQLGADINTADYLAWQQVWHFGDDHTTAVLLKWYARMEDINPQDPFCSTAKTIADEIGRIRIEQKKEDPPLVRAARNNRTFKEELAAFEKAPENFSPDDLFEIRDGFGNSVIDILGARRQLGLLFDSTVWDDKMGDMIEVWSKVAPVYQRMYDINASISRKQASRINRAADAKKWKL